MDRALLERMIGAAVLLLLLVFVAPAMLEGPRDAEPALREVVTKEPATRIETIVLDVAPGSATPEAERAEVDAAPQPQAATQQADAPPAQPKSASQPISKPAETAAKPQPDPTPTPTPAPKPKSQPKPAATAGGSFIVQLGIFSSAENADNFAGRIRKRGFTVSQSTVAGAQGELHRVYVGPRKTRAEAEELAAIMANSGYKGIVTSLEPGG